MAKQARFNEADGMAALSICESLLIALTELKVISEQDARDCRARHHADDEAPGWRLEVRDLAGPLRR